MSTTAPKTEINVTSSVRTNGGKYWAMVNDQIAADGSAIDAMDSVPEVLVVEDDHIIGPTGSRSILVVRVNALDATLDPTLTPSAISTAIFDTSAGSLSVSSQLAACSNNKLLLSPATRTGTDIGTTGITTLDLNQNITSQELQPSGWRSGVEGAITMALNNKYGVSSPDELADHVMYCVPSGTLKGGNAGWLAHAYHYRTGSSFHWLSVYNDEWCTSLSAVIHEFGHNINLSHANDMAFADSSNTNGECEDQTGHMGYSSYAATNARKCYNGAKSWQTGWYQDRHEAIEPIELNANCEQQIQLVGIAEYGDLVAGTGDQKVIVMVTEPAIGNELHIIFNRATGINADTGSWPGSQPYEKVRDKVLITSRSEHDGDPMGPLSFLEAGLSQGEIHTITNYNGGGATLTIAVDSIDITTATPDTATITIKLGDCEKVPSSNPSSNPSGAPSSLPSSSPSSKPSGVPSFCPSTVPSASPSLAPSKSSEGPFWVSCFILHLQGDICTNKI